MSCGEGIHERQRLCDNPPPQFGGRHCRGDHVQFKTCSVEQCAGIQLMSYVCIKVDSLLLSK